MSAVTPPEIELDLRDADAVIDALRSAAQASREAKHRNGGIAQLPSQGRLVITGDLHDHTLNFQRALKFADLAAADDHYLILHELIHGPNLVNGYDLSIRMLARVAALKVARPEQVLLLQSNHELAQLNNEGILKDGHSVVQQFNEGVGFLYHQRADDVMDAVFDYIRALLVGVRCDNGLFIAHSLPSPRKVEKFDPKLLERAPTDEDLADGGSVHLMVWGRRHTDALADQLAEAWGVDLFVLGHQPVDMGYDTVGSRILLVNSDTDHGVALPIDLTRRYSLDQLCDRVLPLAAITLG